MASFVKFKLDDGTIVYVEATDIPKGSSGLIPGSREHAEQAAISFDQSVTTIRKMAVTLMENLRSGFEEEPDELGVSFGIKASGELGDLVVARGGMEANYNVSLRWRNKAKENNEGNSEKDENKKTKAKGASAE